MPAEKIFNITIPGPGPWGFRLAGGRDFNTPLYISKVTAGGKAATSNVLHNDCVTSINGIETDKMTHLEAQGAIKSAMGNLSLKIMRGEAMLWKPKISRDETDAVTNVSLQADKQKFTHAGAKHNVTAKPFGSPGAGGGLGGGLGPGGGLGTATVVHKQFNSPVGIYSSENIADSFKGQTEGMIAGRVGLDMHSGPTQGYGQPAKPYTPTYQEPPSYSHGQASAQYIDKPDDEEMKYSGFINPGSQSRSFKMLQSMTAEEEANMDAAPTGMRSVKAPVTTSGGSKPAPSLPMCVRCNLGIVGPVLKAKDKTLHPECFICYTCSNSLKNKGFFTVQGREYCGDCERQARMDASQGSWPPGSYTNGAPAAHHTPAAAHHAPAAAHHAPAAPHHAPVAASHAPVAASHAPAVAHHGPAHQRGVPPPPAVDKQRRPRPRPPPPPVATSPTPPAAPMYRSKFQPPKREDPNAIIARALMQNPDAVKSCQGIVPIFTVDETVKHEINLGPQSPTTPLQSYPREPGAPDDGVKVMFLSSGSAGKQTPSQIASQARSNPVPRAMSSQPPRAPGPPPVPAYAKSAPRPSPMAPPTRPQHTPQAPHAPQAPQAGGGGAAGRTPMCDGCDSIIRGPFVSAVGRNWHPEHFVCAHCHENLSTQGFVEQNGKVYCEKDFNSLYAPRCSICNKSISQGGCVQAMGNQYHSDCFVCTHCNDPITGSAFHISEGKPYCKRDYQALFAVRCAACNYPVEPGDAWVEALKKQWHSNCFTCSNPSCGAPLEGQAFYADRGQPYCQRHAP